MAKDDSKGGWKEAVWNPRTKEFMGRTASSWGKWKSFYFWFWGFTALLRSVQRATNATSQTRMKAIPTFIR